MQQILCLRLLAEKYSEKDQKVFNCFVDFKKAFDSVWHKGLWAVLRSFGTGPKLIRILQNIYGQTRGAARVNGELTDWFNMTVGNRQGDPISPKAFILYLERLMDPVQEHGEAGVIISGSRINNLKFADDVDLIDKDERGLQQQVDSLRDNSERYGMHINQEKTKTMVFCRREEENDMCLSINNVAVENVPSSSYHIISSYIVCSNK